MKDLLFTISKEKNDVYTFTNENGIIQINRTDIKNYLLYNYKWLFEHFSNLLYRYEVKYYTDKNYLYGYISNEIDLENRIEELLKFDIFSLYDVSNDIYNKSESYYMYLYNESYR